jgi:predicted dehydrogenase
MRKALWLIPSLFLMSASAAEHTIAVVGLVHSHVWGHLGKMVQGKPARLVGVAETAPELVAEAKKRGVAGELFHSDWRKMIDAVKPEIVWAFVENNRHLEIVQYCAPRRIHVIFEKPLASTWKDSVAIRDLARKHGIFVMCNYQMAWWPTSYAARQAVASGELGDMAGRAGRRG